MKTLQQPVFTVIILTYNRKELLQRAIQSVLNQTFSSFELIVIDNGSTDDTSFAVQRINDRRIQYIFNPDSSIFLYDSPRNIGIQIAKGCFISILDDDDIWYPEKLEKVKKIFDENPNISAVCHNLNRRINGMLGTILRCGPWSNDIHERLLYEGNCLAPSAITIKTDLLRKLNGFNSKKEFRGVPDYDLWLRITAEGIKIHFIDEPLGELSFTGNNMSVDPEFQARVTFLIKDNILKYENKQIIQISRRGMWRLFQLYYITGRFFLKTGKYISAFKYYCHAMLFIIIKPSILLNFYSKLRQKLNLPS